MFSKVLVAAVVMASVSAHAVESEFFFQSKGGQSDLTLKLGLLSQAMKPKGGTEVKFTGLVDTGVAYEYGINEQFAIEGALLYTSVESDQTPKRKTVGLQDPTVTLKGTSAMGAANLRYGVGVGLGFQKAKSEPTEDSAATGGFAFSPYIGADTEAAGGTLGGRLTYTLRLERTTEGTGGAADTKTKDGNSVGLSAFYETKVTDATLGAALNYNSFGETKDANSTTVTKSFNTVGVSAYAALPFGTWTMIPRLDYDFTNSELDSYNRALVSVAGRFTF